MKTKFIKSSKNHRKQKGAGMIEVLATVVILAIGLLGVAALQLMSKRSGFESVQRTTASALAMGILERMRSNSTTLNSYAGTLETPPAPQEIVGAVPIPPPLAPNCESGSPCNATQLAANDLWELRFRLTGGDVLTAANDPAGGLITPRACISSRVPAAQLNASGDPDRSGAYQVTIVWRGQTRISNQDPNLCGIASGAYDENPGDNSYRRILTVNAFITES